MKIMYLSFNDPLHGIGVYKKEMSFCNAMVEEACKRGYDFKGINITSFGSFLYSNENFYKILEKTQNFNLLYKTPIIRSLANFYQKTRIAFQEIEKYNPDILIFRYIWLPLVFNPKKIKKDLIFITEHQTKEEYELSIALHKKLTLKPIEKINFKKMFKNLDGIIGVTSEIVNYEIERGGEQKPSFVLTNGIFVNNFPVKKFVNFKNRLNIIFVSAFASVWHGFDRLLFGLKKFYEQTNNIDIVIYVVGNVENGYRDIISKLGLENKVVFCGAKYGKELDEIFDICHIGLGPLAVSRKNLKYASPIKVREYLARGIPVIIGYEDEDIDENFPFVLKFSADEIPIDIQKVLNFCRDIYNKYGEKMIYEIRSYAKSKLDYRAKIPKLLDFLEKLVKRKEKQNL